MFFDKDAEKKPRPVGIANSGAKVDIIYECPSCGASFHLFGASLKYCYNCGQKIDWEDVAVQVPDKVAKMFRECVTVENQKTILGKIEVANQGKPGHKRSHPEI